MFGAFNFITGGVMLIAGLAMLLFAVLFTIYNPFALIGWVVFILMFRKVPRYWRETGQNPPPHTRSGPLRPLVQVTKILWIAVRNAPDQKFVNELYLKKEAKYYQSHYGIGEESRSLPPFE